MHFCALPVAAARSPPRPSGAMALPRRGLVSTREGSDRARQRPMLPQKTAVMRRRARLASTTVRHRRARRRRDADGLDRVMKNFDSGSDGGDRHLPLKTAP